MEKSSFFTSLNGDRKYKASDFAEYFKTFIGNGVFPNPSTNLQVIANGDMTLTLSTGYAWINGYMYSNTDDLVLTLDYADSFLNRIDRVVIRLDYINRNIRAYIKKGESSVSPIPQELQRDVDAYELCIAEIHISAGSLEIIQSNITDTRLNSEICGVVTQMVESIDTTELYKKLQAYIEERGNDIEGWIGEATVTWESEFRLWFDTIKGALGEDAAGNLLNMISEDRVRMSDIEKSLSNIVLTSDRINMIDTNNVFDSLNVDEAMYELYKRDESIAKSLENIKQNQLELLIERDLEDKSTSMDAGYWFDSLKNTNKIAMTNGIISNNKIQSNDLESTSTTTLFKTHNVGFMYSKISFYLKRNEGYIVPVSDISRNTVTIKNYKINMRLE